MKDGLLPIAGEKYGLRQIYLRPSRLSAGESRAWTRARKQNGFPGGNQSKPSRLCCFAGKAIRAGQKRAEPCCPLRPPLVPPSSARSDEKLPFQKATT